jgi:hypothetical protein
MHLQVGPHMAETRTNSGLCLNPSQRISPPRTPVAGGRNLPDYLYTMGSPLTAAKQQLRAFMKQKLSILPPENVLSQSNETTSHFN